MKRAHISLKTKLASALLALGHVPYDDAKALTADQLISLYHWDHGILHGIEINDEYWNLTPILIQTHREKSKRDTAIVAKSKRIRRLEAMHRERISLAAINTELNALKWDPPLKRKIPSRPFPNKKRKFANKSRN